MYQFGPRSCSSDELLNDLHIFIRFTRIIIEFLMKKFSQFSVTYAYRVVSYFVKKLFKKILKSQILLLIRMRDILLVNYPILLGLVD